MLAVMDDDDHFVSLDQLPDDPMKMPPPYWRVSGTTFELFDCVESIASRLLPDLVATQRAWSLVENRNRGSIDENEPETFPPELEQFMEVESRIIHKASLAVFLAAIQAEDAINEFAVYNVPKDAAEAIEKLSPADKLVLVAALVKAPPVKGTAPFEAIRRLSSRRNALAHGHCVDRPTDNLRKNHLISPRELPSVPAQLIEMVQGLRDYFRITGYLRSISVNSYTGAVSLDEEDMTRTIEHIQRYRFDDLGKGAFEVFPPH